MSYFILQVDGMLQNLEKEIDDVDAKIGDRWRLLDRFVVIYVLVCPGSPPLPEFYKLIKHFTVEIICWMTLGYDVSDLVLG